MGSIAARGAIYDVAIGTKACSVRRRLDSRCVPTALYLYSTWVAACEPIPSVDIDINDPVLPPVWPTVKAAMHFLIPIGVLVSVLDGRRAVTRASALQRDCRASHTDDDPASDDELFRRRKSYGLEFMRGMGEVVNGCNDGVRNMIGIAIATGRAGLIVGATRWTGLGAHDRLRRVVSGGNVMVMLPSPRRVAGARHGRTNHCQRHPGRDADDAVIVELGAQSGLVIPLIARASSSSTTGPRPTSRRRWGWQLRRRSDREGDPIQVGIQGSGT